MKSILGIVCAVTTFGLLFAHPARADPGRPDASAGYPAGAGAGPDVSSSKEQARLTFGLEADVVPYVLSGAHGDVWIGVDGWRGRAIAVTLTSPSFLTDSGFKNLHMSMLELEVDRFFGPHAREFRGLWVAAGGGLSILAIDASDGSGHASISAAELSVGIGWSFPLPLHFYVNPWVGLTYQFTLGAEDVGTQVWRPVRIHPAIGFKVGWDFVL